MKIRNPNNNETPVLCKILCETFGNEGQSAFFDMLYSKERSIVACVEGEIAAMGYLIPMGEWAQGRSQEDSSRSQGDSSLVIKCAMIYAVATLPKYRGRGLGAAVTNALITMAYDSGFNFAVACPFEDSLFEFYSDKTRFCEWFYARETVRSQENRPPVITLEKTTPEEYINLRETLLQDIPHIKHNLQCVEFQKALCDEMGGGLYKIGDSCAVVEVQTDGDVWIKELLTDDKDDKEQVMNSLCAKFPSQKYVIRTPAKKGEGRRFGMLAKGDGAVTDICSDFAPWYGLAFD